MYVYFDIMAWKHFYFREQCAWSVRSSALLSVIYCVDIWYSPTGLLHDPDSEDYFSLRLNFILKRFLIVLTEPQSLT